MLYLVKDMTTARLDTGKLLSIYQIGVKYPNFKNKSVIIRAFIFVFR
jgi:hypothetical protein